MNRKIRKSNRRAKVWSLPPELLFNPKLVSFGCGHFTSAGAHCNPNTKHMTRLDFATDYRARGFAPLPVPWKSKNPNFSDWQNYSPVNGDFERDFAGDGNIGLLLGAPSGGLVEVDHDWTESRILAPKFLPETGAHSGRVSAPDSHWWYLADLTTKKYRDPNGKTGDDRAMIVELRSTGAQTIVAPSIHPSGELYEWGGAINPTRVDAADLRRAVSHLAACSLLARYWRNGIRHEAALALAGVLFRNEWTRQEINHFILAAASAANDEEPEDRVAAIVTTEERFYAGENTTGLPTLEELLGEKTVKALAKWLFLKAPDELFIESANAKKAANAENRISDNADSDLRAKVQGATLIENAQMHKTDDETDDAPLETGFYTSLDSLLEAELVETEEIFTAIRRKQITMFVSTTNIGKTTLILNLCLSAAAGENCSPLLPEIPAKPIRIAYLDFEATAFELKADVAKMLEHISLPHKAKENFFPIVDAAINDEPLNLSNQAHFAFVKNWVRALKVDVLVVDTIAAAFDLFNENDNAEVKRRVMRPLKALAMDGNCAVIAIHHKGKMGENEAKEDAYAGRGASNFGALSRAVYTLTREDGKGPGYVTLKLGKAKGAKFEPTMLCLDFEKRWFTVCGEKPPFKKSVLTVDDVADFVKLRKKVKTNAILEQFSERAADRTIKNRIDEAATLGLIKSPKQGYWEFCATAEIAEEGENPVSGNGRKEIEGLCKSANPIGDAQMHKTPKTAPKTVIQTPPAFADDRPEWQQSTEPLGADGKPLPF